MTHPGVSSPSVGGASPAASSGDGVYQTSRGRSPSTPSARAADPCSAMRSFVRIGSAPRTVTVPPGRTADGTWRSAKASPVSSGKHVTAVDASSPT
ncbi:hypothetical protein BFL35_00995 [Clavibacter michiganensis]|nr:hypothetical protein BFL35_00995 [Clavibacter michiganensis]